MSAQIFPTVNMAREPHPPPKPVSSTALLLDIRNMHSRILEPEARGDGILNTLPSPTQHHLHWQQGAPMGTG